jgi:hypothetical protein
VHLLPHSLSIVLLVRIKLIIIYLALIIFLVLYKKVLKKVII